jgi:hypothetical protein
MRDEWEQQPGESSRWYARFEAYRLAGPGRALLPIYNAERHAAGKGRVSRLPGAWNDAAARWCWKQRADAYDAYEREQRRAELRAELAIRQQARLDLARNMQQQAELVFDAAHLDNLTIKEARGLLRVAVALAVEGVRLERLELGEPTELWAPPKPIPAMTDSELDAWIAELEASGEV